MPLDADKIKQRWHERDGSARVTRRDLRDGRPDPPPVEGSPCERCGDLTTEIACHFLDYWICPKCASFFVNLARWAERMRVSTAV
jgi:hypothetical protein